MSAEGGLADKVISKVAGTEGVPEEELPSLYESVETDALEELFDHAKARTGASLEVRFSYVEYTVIIRDPGEISVEA